MLHENETHLKKQMTAEQFFREEWGIEPTSVTIWHRKTEDRSKPDYYKKVDALELSPLDLWDLMEAYSHLNFIDTARES